MHWDAALTQTWGAYFLLATLAVYVHCTVFVSCGQKTTQTETWQRWIDWRHHCGKDRPPPASSVWIWWFTRWNVKPPRRWRHRWRHVKLPWWRHRWRHAVQATWVSWRTSYRRRVQTSNNRCRFASIFCRVQLLTRVTRTLEYSAQPRWHLRLIGTSEDRRRDLQGKRNQFNELAYHLRRIRMRDKR